MDAEDGIENGEEENNLAWRFDFCMVDDEGEDNNEAGDKTYWGYGLLIFI
jgi:hypothetical protein